MSSIKRPRENNSSDDDDDDHPEILTVTEALAKRRSGKSSSVVAIPRIPNRMLLSRGKNPLIVPQTEAEAEVMIKTIVSIFDENCAHEASWNRLTAKAFHCHFETVQVSDDAGGCRRLAIQRQILSSILTLCKTRFGEAGARLVKSLEMLSIECSSLISEFLYPRHSPSMATNCSPGQLLDKGVNGRQSINMVGALNPGAVPDDMFNWHPFAKSLRVIFLEDGFDLRAGTTELLQHSIYHPLGAAVTAEQVSRARRASESLTKSGFSRSVSTVRVSEEARQMREKKKDQRRAVPIAGRVDYPSVYVPFRDLIEGVASVQRTATAAGTPLTAQQLDLELHDVIVAANVKRGQHHLNEDGRSVLVDHSADAADDVAADVRLPITADEILYQHSIEVRFKDAANLYKDSLSEIFSEGGASIFDNLDVLKAVTMLSRVNTREARVGQNGAMNWFIKCFKDLLLMTNGDERDRAGSSSSSPRLIKKHNGKSVEQVVVGARFQFYSMITTRLMLYWLDRKKAFGSAKKLPGVLKDIDDSFDRTPTKRDKYCDFLGVRRGDGGTAANVLRSRRAPEETTTLALIDGASSSSSMAAPTIFMWALETANGGAEYHVMAPFHDSATTLRNMKRGCSILMKMSNLGHLPAELLKRIESGESTSSSHTRFYTSETDAILNSGGGDDESVDVTSHEFDMLWLTSTWFLPFQHVGVDLIRTQMLALHKKVDEAISFHEGTIRRWDLFHPQFIQYFNYWSGTAVDSSEDNLYSYAFSSAASEMIKSETACRHSKETLRLLFGDHPDMFKWLNQSENARRLHVTDLQNTKGVLDAFDAIIPREGKFYPLVSQTLTSIVDFFCTLKTVVDKHGEQLDVDFESLSTSSRNDKVSQERQNLTWTRVRIEKFSTQRDKVNESIANVAYRGFVLGRSWGNNSNAKTTGFNMPYNVETKLKLGLGYTFTTIGICNLRNAIRFTSSPKEHEAFMLGELDGDPEWRRAALCVLHSSTDDTDRRIDMRTNLLDFGRMSMHNWTTVCMVAYVGRGVVSNNRNVKVDVGTVILDDRHVPVRLSQTGTTFFEITHENTERFARVYSSILENVKLFYPTSTNWSFIDVKTAEHFETLVVYHQNVMASNGSNAGFFTFPGVRERPNSEYLLMLTESDRIKISNKQDWGRFQSVTLSINELTTTETTTTATISAGNRRSMSFDDDDTDDDD